jgi:hypothetical protein
MTKDEALRLAWDALQQIAHVSAMDYEYQQWAVEAITAIKKALAQPEHGWTPERIAGMGRLKEAQDKKLAQVEQPKVRTGNCLRVGVCASEGHKIAPQRTWIGLTYEDKSEICDMTERDERDSVMRLVEAKLKARNI